MEKFNWLTYWEQQDISEIEGAIDILSNQLIKMREKLTEAQIECASMREDNWKDEELIKMRTKLISALEDNTRGFPISAEEAEQINKWQEQHDTEIHNNPMRYHGATGGGYEYLFTPTSIGVIGECMCSTCRRKAIMLDPENWLDVLVDMNGVLCFQSL